MAFPECNSAGLLPLIPCYECVDGDKLLAMKIVVMCNIVKPAGITCTNAAQLRNSASCLACLGDLDLERLEVAGLCAYSTLSGNRDQNCSVESLMADAKCLACLSHHDLNAIYKWLFCNWLKAQAELAQ